MHAGEADDDAEILGEREPGRDVRVVVEPCADDLVTLAQRAASARVSRKLSDVMLGPNATSSGWQQRKRPAVAWARSTSSTVRMLVSYGAPMFALSSRR